MPRRIEQQSKVIKSMPLMIHVLTFVVGNLVSVVSVTMWFSRTVATVPYVDQRHDEALKYTDKAAASTLQSAYEHSDANRQSMMIEIKSQGSDIKAMGAKQDVLLDSVRTIQQQIYDSRRMR